VKDWLDRVNKMAFLNGVVDLHFSEDVMQALASLVTVTCSPGGHVPAVRIFVDASLMISFPRLTPRPVE
jgi:hypothetical protein